jgi:signal transduction histidine kinase
MTIKIKFSIILIIIGLLLGAYTIVLVWNTSRNLRIIRVTNIEFTVLLAAAKTRTHIDWQIKEATEYLRFRSPESESDTQKHAEHAKAGLEEWKAAIKKMLLHGVPGKEDNLANINRVEKLYLDIGRDIQMSFELAKKGENEAAFQTIKAADMTVKELFGIIDMAMRAENKAVLDSHRVLLGRLGTMPWRFDKSLEMLNNAEMPIYHFLGVERVRSAINRQMKDALDYLLAAEEDELKEYQENGVKAHMALHNWLTTVQLQIGNPGLNMNEDLRAARNVEKAYHQVLELMSLAFEMKLAGNSSEVARIMKQEVDPIFNDILMPNIEKSLNSCKNAMGEAHDEFLDFSYSAGVQSVTFFGFVLVVILTLTASLTIRTAKSFRLLRAGMDIIGKGELDYRIQLNSRDELGQLADYFDGMTEKLQKVTQLEQEQERIANSRERMAHVGEISAGVIHSIRNPLHGVINCTEILQSKMYNIGETEQEIFDMMQEGLERIERVTQRLLVLTRDVPLQKIDADINELLQKSLKFLEMDARKKNVNLLVSLAGDLPKIKIDPDRFTEGIMNLLNNALDACQDGDTISLVTKKCSQPGNGISIIIEDSGEGIPADVQSKVNDPFFTTKPIGKGTGLGLPISRRIVEEHGGLLEMESTENLGTKINMFLPYE